MIKQRYSNLAKFAPLPGGFMTSGKLLLAACGGGLLLWMLLQVGWDAIVASLRLVGFGGFAGLLALFALAQIPTCVAWRWVMGSSRHRVTLWSLYPAYAVGDALNATIPSADTAGEVAKVLMLKKRMPWESAAASVTLHRVLEVIAVSLLLTLGLVVSWIRLDLPVWWYAIGLAVLAGMVGLVAAFLRLQRTGLYGPLFRHLLTRFGRSAQSGEGIDAEMRSTLSEHRTVLLASIMVCVSWFAGVLEAYLCLRWLGLPAHWDVALTVESFGLFIANLGYFVPGRLGVNEGGRVLLFAALGVPMPGAITFAIVRRLREVAWIGVGFALLLAHRRREHNDAGDLGGAFVTRIPTTQGDHR